jgi:hypothetical protein
MIMKKYMLLKRRLSFRTWTDIYIFGHLIVIGVEKVFLNTSSSVKSHKEKFSSHITVSVGSNKKNNDCSTRLMRRWICFLTSELTLMDNCWRHNCLAL